MANQRYDLITVGGGLGGASLAKVMAEQGRRVLVLERETVFKDRVRGEQMSPWGVEEAQNLGVYETLSTGLEAQGLGGEIRWWETHLGDAPSERRDLVTTTPQQNAWFSFFHPALQEVLLTTTKSSGAEVWRGARVTSVQPGSPPRLTVEQEGRVTELSARLIVGADGRTSMMRKWAGFPVRKDPPRRRMAGAWFEELPGFERDAIHWIVNFHLGQSVLMSPEGESQVRAYLIHQHDAPFRLQGAEDMSRFVEESIRAGAPAEWYVGAKPNGPLATFEGADTWVEHPYKDGVALIGDAAASSDPSFGQGLSLTVRDVRTLRDQLVSQNDWDVAGHAYATAHDEHYGVLHRVSGWIGQMMYEPGPEADARRARAFPLIAQDPSRVPDHLASGPDLPADERVRRRFFGEE